MNHTKQFLFGCLAVVALLAHLRQLHAAEERRSSLAAAVGVATENVGRGISYSSEKPAVFGRIAWRGGDFELAAAAITVSGGTANVEVAVAARYYFLVDRFELRAQIEHTAYPGAEPNIDYWEFGLNIRREWETFALELGLRESPDDSGGAQYAFVDLSQRLWRFADLEVRLKSRLGWRPYDDNVEAGRRDYLHWSAGAELSFDDLTFDATYHDTDLPAGGSFPSDARFVVRASYAFSLTD